MNHQQMYATGNIKGWWSSDKNKMIPDKRSERQGRIKGNAIDKYVGKQTLTVKNNNNVFLSLK